MRGATQPSFDCPQIDLSAILGKTIIKMPHVISLKSLICYSRICSLKIFNTSKYKIPSSFKPVKLAANWLPFFLLIVTYDY